jgi:membrane fusion protein, multidrug efflux system
VIAEKRDLGQLVALTGQILAEKETALAFRIGGRIIERLVDVGQRVEPDQVLAKLDPQNELNALRLARAALSTAQSRLEKDANQFHRQETLLGRGFTTRVLFDQAQQAYRASQAAVDDAKAQLEIAEDRVSYTQLKANVSGTITGRGSHDSPHFK